MLWSERHARYYIELKRADVAEAEKFEMSNSAYQEIDEHDIVQAEVAPISREVLRIMKLAK